MNKYVPVIGLEVHVELKTKSKMFCSCSTEYFGAEPNTHTCPVCLGLPGALPVPNKTAIDWCVMIALALNCRINEFSKFDRKNYFYPDLAKGYQISQYDLPFGENGSMLLSTGKKIGITRVHMEEDTAKLTHQFGIQNEQSISLVDFNRSGMPLVEIVTEPDFTEAQEVNEYLQRLQQIVRYLDVSAADMEKGEMRLEPNISLKSVIQGSKATSESKTDTGQASMTKNDLPNYKVEVKNINSFKFVEKAINYEIKRQQEILEKGETPAQETRGWNEVKQKTFSQRSKESAHDYRYFPEPDIPPITFTKAQLAEIISRVPELPDAKLLRFSKEYSLPEYDSEILTREKPFADFFEQAVKDGGEFQVTPKQIANFLINKKIEITGMSPADVIKHIKQSTQKTQVDETKLTAVINEVITENPKAVADYKSGKENVIMYLVGQTMRKLAIRVDVQLIKDKLLSALK